MRNLDDQLAEISERCLELQLSIATAESVTAGYLQFTLSQMPETISIFNGGITAYNIGQKVKHLGLDYITGEQCNCVSESTAKVMALNVCNLFNSKLGISITGYASPVPEEGIHDLFAYAVISLGGTILYGEKLSSKQSTPLRVQQDYVHQLIVALLTTLRQL